VSTYAHDPTIGLLELSSIARGIEATDRMLKEATVRILFARPVSPGKYVTLFTGSVEDVESSLRVGVETAEDSLVDQLLLPAVHDGVFGALSGAVEVAELDAVGVIETRTMAGVFRAADRAAKTAQVTLLEMQLARGIGGKSFVTMTGEVGDVEAALDAGALPEEQAGCLISRVLIPRPHGDMRDVLGRHQESI